MASPHPTTGTKSNETLYAVIASAVIAVILASLLTGSPFHAIHAGYVDQSRSHAPAAPAPVQK